MLRSMTGYGGATAQIEGVDYAIEIRSVNGRYLKANMKLPEMWSHFEANIEKMLRKALHRGSVNFSLRMKMRSEAAAYTVNPAALKAYIEQARSVLPDGANIDLGSMLQLPGVCQPPESEQLCDRSRPVLVEAIGEAIGKLVEMRQREGEALHADLLSHCDDIERQLAVIVPRKDTVLADYRDRLLARVSSLINSAELTLGEQDLIREVAIYAERSDISEEIARLRCHIEQFRQVAGARKSDGRKLEFIGQEMLREANTIGSKSNDAEIARAIVEIKGAVDRIKEQVQNAE